MSKQKENEFRIETEIAINLAKYWYERAERKSYTSENSTVVNLSDLASILDQLPEPEKQPDITAAEMKLRAIRELLDRVEPELKEKRKGTAGLGFMQVIITNIREILK